MTTKITRKQRTALVSLFNLSDAHTRQSLNADQCTQIVQNLTEIFQTATTGVQQELERKAYRNYIALGNQIAAKELMPLVCYSASMAMEVVANVLRAKQLSPITLVEPCFDNIPDILKRHQITLIPFDARLYVDPDRIWSTAHAADAKAIMLLLPNNPTGHHMEADAFVHLARKCHEHRVLLIIDFCFRLYDDVTCKYDQYLILNESGVDYIAIEDTGKIFPTLDQKVSFINVSPGLRERFRLVHDDFLLNVSPFTLELVERYCNVSRGSNLADFRDLIASNRSRFREWVSENIPSWRSYIPESTVSVEFGSISSAESTTRLATRLRRETGVAILGGAPFYWSGDPAGERYLRVALARDERYLASALAQLSAGIVNRRHPDKIFRM